MVICIGGKRPLIEDYECIVMKQIIHKCFYQHTIIAKYPFAGIVSNYCK